MAEAYLLDKECAAKHRLHYISYYYYFFSDYFHILFYPSIYQSLYLSIYIYLSIHLFFCLSLFLHKNIYHEMKRKTLQKLNNLKIYSALKKQKKNLSFRVLRQHILYYCICPVCVKEQQ